VSWKVKRLEEKKKSPYFEENFFSYLILPHLPHMTCALLLETFSTKNATGKTRPLSWGEKGRPLIEGRKAVQDGDYPTVRKQNNPAAGKTWEGGRRPQSDEKIKLKKENHANYRDLPPSVPSKD